MNHTLCKDCREGIGPTYRYLPEIIKQYRDSPHNKGQIAIADKLLSFFGQNSRIDQIEDRLKKLEESIKGKEVK